MTGPGLGSSEVIPGSVLLHPSRKIAFCRELATFPNSSGEPCSPTRLPMKGRATKSGPAGFVSPIRDYCDENRLDAFLMPDPSVERLGCGWDGNSGSWFRGTHRAKVLAEIPDLSCPGNRFASVASRSGRVSVHGPPTRPQAVHPNHSIILRRRRLFLPPPASHSRAKKVGRRLKTGLRTPLNPPWRRPGSGTKSSIGGCPVVGGVGVVRTLAGICRCRTPWVEVQPLQCIGMRGRPGAHCRFLGYGTCVR